MKEAVGFWLELIVELVVVIVIVLAAAYVGKEVSSTKPAQKEGLRIKKKGEE